MIIKSGDYFAEVSKYGYKLDNLVLSGHSVDNAMCIRDNVYLAEPRKIVKKDWVVPKPIMDEANLYRKFLKIKRSTDVIKFAESYGMLGRELRPWSWDISADPLDEESYERIYIDEEVETLASWRIAWQTMKVCVDIFDAIGTSGSADRKQLSKYIVQEPNGTLSFAQPVYSISSNTTLIVKRDFAEEILDSNPATFYEDVGSSLVKPAREILRKLVNENLQGHVEYSISCDGPNSRPFYYSHMAPKSLFGVLWLQFSNALTKTGMVKNCEYCQKEIEQLKRSTRRFCNGTCRKRYERAGKQMVE